MERGELVDVPGGFVDARLPPDAIEAFSEWNRIIDYAARAAFGVETEAGAVIDGDAAVALVRHQCVTYPCT